MRGPAAPPTHTMWALILSGLLVGATVSAAEPDAWTKGYLYKYKVQSKALTALHEVANQFAGVQIEGYINAQLINSTTVSFELTDFQVAEVHQNLSGGWDADIPESQLSFRKLDLGPSNVVYLNYSEGIISNITVRDFNDVNKEWGVNMIKAFASAFQLDIRGANKIRRPAPRGDSAIYLTMEDVVTGQCLTSYAYARYPKYAALSDDDIDPENWQGDDKLFTVSKAINFTKCEKRAGYAWGLNTLKRWEPIENSLGQTIARSSNAEAVISGSIRKYTIQKSVITNRVILNPLQYEQQKGMLGSQVKVTLQQKIKSDRPIPEIQVPKTYDDLVYEYVRPSPVVPAGEAELSEESAEQAYRPRRQFKRAVWDNADESGSSSSSSSSEEGAVPEPDVSEAPFLPFLYSEQRKGRPAVQSIIGRIEQIARNILEPSSIPSSDTLASFQILNRELMGYDLASLRQLANKLYARYPENPHSYSQALRYLQWVVFINGISQCGSGPALKLINEQIKLQKLQGALAAGALGSIPRSALFPNKPYLKEFFLSVKYTEKNSPENSTAALAFSNLVYLASVDKTSSHNLFPVHLYGKLDGPSESDLKLYVKHFANLLKRAVKNADSVGIQVYTRTLGNFGHPYILKFLLPYILGEERVSDFQRLLMVLAMDRVVELYPEIVRPILVQVYQSTGETHQIRSAAVLLIMGSKPSPSVLQRLAQFSKQDPSPHVVSVVKTAIQSAAQLTSPENEELARSAMAAVNMLSQNKTAVQYSAKHLQDHVAREMAVAYNLKYSQLGSKDALLPNALYAGLKLNIGGLEHLAGEAQAAVSSIKNLRHLIGDIFVEGEENEKKPSKGPAADIVTDLRQQLEGQILGNVMAHPAIFAFDNNTIHSLVEAVSQNVSKLEEGLPFNWTNLVTAFDVRLNFPNAVGLPCSIVFETPVLYSVGGELRLKTSPKLNSAPKGHLAIPTVWNITADVRAVYSKRNSGSVSFTVPPLDKSYSAGYVQNKQFQVPVRVIVDIDAEGNSTYVKLQPIDKNHRYQLSHMSSIPYTTIIRMSPVEPPTLTAPGTEIIHSGNQRSWKAEYGKRSTGMVYSVEYSSEKDYDDLYDKYQRFAQHDALSALLFSNADQEVYYSNISVYYEPKKSISKAVELQVQYYEAASSSRAQNPAQSEESQDSEDQPKSKGASDEDIPFESEDAESQYYRSKREAIFWGRPRKFRRQADSENKAVLKDSDSDEPHKELIQRLQAQGSAQGSIVKALSVNLTFVQDQGASSQLTIVWANSPVSSQSELLAFAAVKAAQADRPYKVCLDAVSMFPNHPYMNFEAALKSNPNSSVNIKLNSGRGSCSSGMSVEADLEIGRSQSRYQYLKNSRVVALCRSQMRKDNNILPACRNATIMAGLLNNYDLEVEFKKLPEELKQFLYGAFLQADYVHFLYGSQNVVNGTGVPGKLNANLIVAPNMRSLNFSFSSPYLDAEYKNVRLNMAAAKAIVSHPMLPRAERVANYYTNWQYNATCSVDSSYIKTYDNLTYPFQSKSPCWRILLTTARLRDVKPSQLVQSPNVTVMVREISGKREVRVLVGDNIVSVAHLSGKYLLKANGQAAAISQSQVTVLNDKQGEPLVLAYGLPDCIRMEIAELILHIDQRRVLLQPSDIYRREVRGLCGTFDGQKQTDFKLPANCIVRNVTEFIQYYSYGDKCVSPRRPQPKQCYPEQIIPGNHTIPESPADPTCISLRHRIVLQGRSLCISKKPLPMCKLQCKALDTVEKDVYFRCYPRTQAIQTIAAEAQQGGRLDVDGIEIEGTDKKIRVSVATACTRDESEDSESDEN